MSGPVGGHSAREPSLGAVPERLGERTGKRTGLVLLAPPPRALSDRRAP